MEFIKNYRLEENNQGYTLILYLDLGLTEFANGFESKKEDQIHNLDEFIKDFIKTNFSDIKINSVKLMIGTIVVATINLQGLTGFAEGLSPRSRPVFNMTYSYFETGNDIITTLSNTGEVLDVVSPTYFDLTSNGHLKITQQFHPDTIRQVQNRGIRVVPFLSNHWDRDVGKAALKNKDILIKQIGYTGGWHGSFDYSKLAQYADYLMIMAYDEHYDTGDAGPVASIGFVEESIKYALKYAPPSKIVLGLPFYGRQWKSDGSIKGKGASLVRINELIKKYNGTIKFDNYTKSPMATVNITGYEVGLPKGKYTIWFENEESILYKLNLIEKYNLKGTGSWSLHQATQNIWNIYNQWSNGNRTFVHLVEGWAKAPILSINEKGWMIGTRDFYFEPNRALTRAEAASLLVRVLELKNTYSYIPYFEDIPYNHWAKKDIFQGYEDETFRPKEKVTRAQMASLLDRIKDILP